MKKSPISPDKNTDEFNLLRELKKSPNASQRLLANELGIMSIREDNLKNLKNDKILLKNLISTYDIFFCSDTIIKKLPRLIGPELYKKGKYPEVIHTDDNIPEKINI